MIYFDIQYKYKYKTPNSGYVVQCTRLTWHSAVLFPPDQVHRQSEGHTDQSS